SVCVGSSVGGFLFVFFCFFFQAEDGIRDFHVTGVQTCALPICGEVSLDLRRRQLIGVRTTTVSRTSLRASLRTVGVVRASETRRSEERRVGKECRSRGSAYP